MFFTFVKMNTAKDFGHIFLPTFQTTFQNGAKQKYKRYILFLELNSPKRNCVRPGERRVPLSWYSDGRGKV